MLLSYINAFGWYFNQCKMNFGQQYNGPNGESLYAPDPVLVSLALQFVNSYPAAKKSIAFYDAVLFKSGPSIELEVSEEVKRMMQVYEKLTRDLEEKSNVSMQNQEEEEEEDNDDQNNDQDKNKSAPLEKGSKEEQREKSENTNAVVKEDNISVTEKKKKMMQDIVNDQKKISSFAKQPAAKKSDRNIFETGEILSSSPTLQYIYDEYWAPWLKKVYLYLKVFGVCPYYKKKIEGTVYWKFEVPSMELGFWMTYVNSQTGRQEFVWFWYNNNIGNGVSVGDMFSPSDTEMYWETSTECPSPKGDLKTAVISLLTDYQMYVGIQKDLRAVSSYNANPPIYLKYIKDASIGYDVSQIDQMDVTTENSYISGDTASAIQAQTMDQIEKYLANKGRMIQRNNQRRMQADLSLAKTFIKTPNPKQEINPFPPDYDTVNVKPPSVISGVEERLRQRLDKNTYDIFNYPGQANFFSSSKRNADMHTSFKFYNMTLPSTLSKLEQIVEKAWYRSVGVDLYNDLYRGNRPRINVSVNRDPALYLHIFLRELFPLKVKIASTSLIDIGKLKELREEGIINQEYFKHVLRQIHGIMEWGTEGAQPTIINKNSSNLKVTKDKKKKKETEEDKFFVGGEEGEEEDTTY